MKRLKPHHHIPGLRRLYLQRDEGRAERDRAIAERDEGRAERDRAIAERDEALRQREDAFLQGSAVERELEGIKRSLFVPPGHFYSPIVETAAADAYLTRIERQTPPMSITGIKIDHAEMVEKWKQLATFLQEIPFPSEKSSDFRYAFANENYSWGDGGVLYAMLRQYAPDRIIEVGSGWSSACAVDTIERYFDKECRITFIDPYPQLVRDLVGNTSIYTRTIETPVQQVALSVFDELTEGDILFIDSTHVLRTGGDVCFELFEVLPRLASGVLVHFHDIFWPFEYPRIWVVNDNRSWNELYAIRAFLTNNADWRIIFFNDYFAKTEKRLIQDTYPNFLRNPGGALWLQRR
jgi:hypothetical protein